jgi:uncharacterized protein (DUF1330 family)
MTTYAIAQLRNVTMGPDILAYLQAIDATMEPFGGRFVLHGDGKKRVLEGSFSGDLVMIAFPYDSPAYRAILPLRTENSDGDVILMDGVGSDHRATDILKG